MSDQSTSSSPTEPVAEAPAEEVKPVMLSNDELKGLAGELTIEPQPGEEINRDGWLKVDAEGSPEGSATLKPPSDGGTPAFPIRANLLAVPSSVVTASGAEIMDSGMQPSPQLSKYSSPSYNRDYTKDWRNPQPAEPPAA